MSSFSELNKYFRYCPQTGCFWWKKVPKFASRVSAGDVAGRIDGRGYVQLTLKRKRYIAHRVAWLLTYGDWPVLEIDHINHNKLDNRLKNLRQITTSENLSSRRGYGKSKIAGVYPNKNGYQIKRKGQNLGWTKDFFEAVCIRKAAETI